MREMSATEFFHEFGGGSLGNVHWHFQKLAEDGWLRLVARRQGPRGRPQNVYRATELAYYDDECAEELPPSVRAAFSTRILQQMGERIALARAASTIDSREDHYFSLRSVRLDEPGWGDSIEVLNQFLRALGQEQLDAKVRIAASGESPSLLMVALAGFESPTHRATDRAARGRTRATPEMNMNMDMPLETRLAKVFADPVNIRILNEITDVEMSPSELEAKIGHLPDRGADHKCKHLEKYGWVARVEENPGDSRRGSGRVFYRATKPPIDVELWPEAARLSGPGRSAQSLHKFYELVVDSIRAGVFDARHNRYLTWSALLLDEVGWRQVMKLLETEEKRLIRIQSEANQRLKAAKISGFPTTFFFSGFEIPPLTDVATS